MTIFQNTENQGYHLSFCSCNIYPILTFD